MPNLNRNVNYKRKGKRKITNKTFKGDNLIEAIAKRVARQEIDKNKKDKYLVHFLRGSFNLPAVDYETDTYQEPYISDPAEISNVPFYGTDIMIYPQIRHRPYVKDVTQPVANVQFQSSNDLIYSDGNELGNSRSGSTILVSGFRIYIELMPNNKIQEDQDQETEISFMFYETYADNIECKKSMLTQYLLSSKDQKFLSKRMIKDCLGSSANTLTDGNQNKLAVPIVGDTVKKVLLKKTFILRKRQQLYNNTARDDLRYIQSNIRESYYIPINKKIEYSLGNPLGAQAGALGSRRVVPVSIGKNATQNGVEVTDSFVNRKYVFCMKSNRDPTSSIPPHIHSDGAPLANVVITTYFQDVN